MVKTELFLECIHSEEPDLTCPFAEQLNDETFCTQTLGFHNEAVTVADLKSCFMLASPRDKVSMINKINSKKS